MEDEQHIKHLEEALKRVFGIGEERQRFIDVSRVPLICQSIVQMADSIKAIERKIEEKVIAKERFELVERVVYGGIGFVLLAVLGALVTLVLK